MILRRIFIVITVSFFNLQDYIQYFLDLDGANQQSQVDTADLWKEEYRAALRYDLQDLTTASLSKIATDMRRGCESKDLECPASFKDYHVFNTVSYNKDACDEECQKFQLCAVTEVEETDYNSCMDNWGSDATQPSANFVGILLAAVVSANIV